jgi:outer membrane receptor protein involved in Fe transport
MSANFFCFDRKFRAFDKTTGKLPWETTLPFSSNAPAVTVKHLALYVQEDWKLTPKLTLNLGLRWEYEGVLTDRFNQLSNFDPNLKSQVGNVPVTGGLVCPGVNGVPCGAANSKLPGKKRSVVSKRGEGLAAI